MGDPAAIHKNGDWGDGGGSDCDSGTGAYTAAFTVPWWSPARGETHVKFAVAVVHPLRGHGCRPSAGKLPSAQRWETAVGPAKESCPQPRCHVRPAVLATAFPPFMASWKLSSSLPESSPQQGSVTVTCNTGFEPPTVMRLAGCY
eukprot:366052-Chlamydomonas_euryale.AAC.12